LSTEILKLHRHRRKLPSTLDMGHLKDTPSSIRNVLGAGKLSLLASTTLASAVNLEGALTT